MNIISIKNNYGLTTYLYYIYNIMNIINSHTIDNIRDVMRIYDNIHLFETETNKITHYVDGDEFSIEYENYVRGRNMVNKFLEGDDRITTVQYKFDNAGYICQLILFGNYIGNYNGGGTVKLKIEKININRVSIRGFLYFMIHLKLRSIISFILI